jgi:hypothetical protein
MAKRIERNGNLTLVEAHDGTLDWVAPHEINGWDLDHPEDYLECSPEHPGSLSSLPHDA